MSEREVGETLDEPHDPPIIDLEHLERLTMNDLAVQRDVLMLFRRLSVEHLERMKVATDVAECRAAAHSLAGAARGVGAGRVADIASTIETAGKAGQKSLEALELAVRMANEFIDDYLPD